MYATFTRNCYLISYYISLEGSVAHLLSDCQALRRRVCRCLSHPHILPIRPFSACKHSFSSSGQTIGSDQIVSPRAWTWGRIKSESATWIETHKIRVDEQIKSVKIQKNSSELFLMFLKYFIASRRKNWSLEYIWLHMRVNCIYAPYISFCSIVCLCCLSVVGFPFCSIICLCYLSVVL